MLGIQNSRIDGESNRLIREVMETTRISVNENTIGAANRVEKLVRIITDQLVTITTDRLVTITTDQLARIITDQLVRIITEQLDRIITDRLARII